MVFLLLLAGAALFVWETCRTLPPVVATHFGASGAANGFMPRSFYLRFMLAFVVLLPLSLTAGLGRILRMPNARINLPERDYWLAAERRAETVEVLVQYLRVFSVVLVAFLCYVHWQVVRANQLAPPALDNARFSAGLGAFLLALVVWIVALRRRFRVPAR